MPLDEEDEPPRAGAGPGMLLELPDDEIPVFPEEDTLGTEVLSPGRTAQPNGLSIWGTGTGLAMRPVGRRRPMRIKW